ncbi:MAG: 3-isopropylmalate dehydratase large subunit [Candidatus Tectomicrobia bacterium]|nr:3-isopropylmalate dehydratase large subunit [Candidatus Tectomicrobia bacterium]
MSHGTLYDKVWERHKVATLPTGQDQIFIGLHLIHEVTSPAAFGMLREEGRHVAFPQRTFATTDHIIPTTSARRPFADPQAEGLLAVLEESVAANGIEFFGLDSGSQGIVHVIGPELGLSQPGMTIACGDSHTSTHGAFGAIAMGIGTTQIRHVLETQTLALDRLKVRRLDVNGELRPGVTAKDVILAIINRLGVGGGKGYAYEYGGSAVERMDMEARLTLCNMSIEGGALNGYVNPDEVTFAYLRGRRYAPRGAAFERAVAYWRSVASDSTATYDDRVRFDAAILEPMVTWGINPGQSVGVTQRLPEIAALAEEERRGAEAAYRHMKLRPGDPILGTPIDVAFIGSCTNGRITDLRAAAAVFKGRKVAAGVTVLVVPGSQAVNRQAEEEGLPEVFRAAGAEWRGPGCSMCLGMNPDKLVGEQICASSSNRNFIGRQGSPRGRTLLMSPAMAAAAAVTGKITDVRTLEREPS